MNFIEVVRSAHCKKKL